MYATNVCNLGSIEVSLRKEYTLQEWTLDHFISDSEHTYHGHYNYKE